MSTAVSRGEPLLPVAPSSRVRARASASSGRAVGVNVADGPVRVLLPRGWRARRRRGRASSCRCPTRRRPPGTSEPSLSTSSAVSVSRPKNSRASASSKNSRPLNGGSPGVGGSSPALIGAQGREVGRQAVGSNLVQLDRLANVLQPVLPNGTSSIPAGMSAATSSRVRPGHQDLATVRRQRRSARRDGRPSRRSPFARRAARRCGVPCAPAAARPAASGGPRSPAAPRRCTAGRRSRAGTRRRTSRPGCRPRNRSTPRTRRAAVDAARRGGRRIPAGVAPAAASSPRCP